MIQFKVLPGIFLAFLLCFTLFSCGSGNSGVDAPSPQSEVVETPPAKPGAAEVDNLEVDKDNVVPATDAEKARNKMVEKTELVEEAPVDDAGFDYKKLAQAVCNCGAKHMGKDHQEGDVHVSKDDKEYQAEVDCALKAKDKMSSEEISRQKLVSAIKTECHDIPGKLVMSLMMAMAE